MADIGEKIQPLVDSVVEPGENVEGACVGSRTQRMMGKFVTVVTTDARVIVQETDRKFQRAKGEPLSLAPERVASAKVGGAGGWGGDLQSGILNKTSLAITIKTTEGEKVKLMVGKATGMLGNLMGGSTQEDGVNALVTWLRRHARA